MVENTHTGKYNSNYDSKKKLRMKQALLSKGYMLLCYQKYFNSETCVLRNLCIFLTTSKEAQEKNKKCIKKGMPPFPLCLSLSCFHAKQKVPLHQMSFPPVPHFQGSSKI